jgi:hypothetical protein
MTSIRTSAYAIENAYAAYRDDYFWIGTNLANGGFVQFGYILLSGYYCLKGVIIHGLPTCRGKSEDIVNPDPRWDWEYFPDLKGADYYWEIGPSMSADQNETWHSYSIAQSQGGWVFTLDGNQVSSFSAQPSLSKSSPYELAEHVTTVNPGRLGPVEFRNMSYLKLDGWHQVGALIAITACEIDAPCTILNPYGISVLGPNHIIAGSGIQKRANGELLWGVSPQTYFTAALGRALLPTATVTIILVSAFGYALLRRRRKTKKSQV